MSKDSNTDFHFPELFIMFQLLSEDIRIILSASIL